MNGGDILLPENINYFKNIARLSKIVMILINFAIAFKTNIY